MMDGYQLVSTNWLVLILTAVGKSLSIPQWISHGSFLVTPSALQVPIILQGRHVEYGCSILTTANLLSLVTVGGVTQGRTDL